MKEKMFAGFWQRLSAQIVDIILYLVIVIGTYVIKFGWNEVIYCYEPDRLLFLAITIGVIAIANFVMMVLLGSNIAKLIFGIKIVNLQTGKTPHAGRILLRSFSKILSFIPFGLGFIQIDFHPQKRAWHDVLSKTVCVNRRSFKQRPQSFLTPIQLSRKVKQIFLIILFSYILLLCSTAILFFLDDKLNPEIELLEKQYNAQTAEMDDGAYYGIGFAVADTLDPHDEGLSYITELSREFNQDNSRKIESNFYLSLEYPSVGRYLTFFEKDGYSGGNTNFLERPGVIDSLYHKFNYLNERLNNLMGYTLFEHHDINVSHNNPFLMSSVFNSIKLAYIGKQFFYDDKNLLSLIITDLQKHHDLILRSPSYNASFWIRYYYSDYFKFLYTMIDLECYKDDDFCDFINNLPDFSEQEILEVKRNTLYSKLLIDYDKTLHADGQMKFKHTYNTFLFKPNQTKNWIYQFSSRKLEDSLDYSLMQQYLDSVFAEHKTSYWNLIKLIRNFHGYYSYAFIIDDIFGSIPEQLRDYNMAVKRVKLKTMILKENILPADIPEFIKSHKEFHSSNPNEYLYYNEATNSIDLDCYKEPEESYYPYEGYIKLTQDKHIKQAYEKFKKENRE